MHLQVLIMTLHIVTVKAIGNVKLGSMKILWYHHVVFMKNNFSRASLDKFAEKGIIITIILDITAMMRLPKYGLMNMIPKNK